MLGGASCTQRGNGVGKAHLGQCNHVHVPLGDQRIAMLAQGGAGFKQTVELAALAEHRRLRRIEVFGFVIANDATAEADALTLDIANRKHDPVSKAVVALDFALGAVFPSLAADDQPAFNQQWVVVVRKHAGQATPPFRGITQAKGFCDRTGQSAALEIANGPLRAAQMLDISQASFFKHAGEGSLLLANLRRFRPILRRHIVLWHLQTHLLGQVVDGLDKGHAGLLHQKADGITVFAAAKTVIELLGGAHAEGGGFLAMKWAQTHEIGTAFFQLDMSAHNVHHVGTR